MDKNKSKTHALKVQTQVDYRGAVANPMDEGMPQWSPGRAERRNAGIDSLAAFPAPNSPCTQTDWSFNTEMSMGRHQQYHLSQCPQIETYISRSHITHFLHTCDTLI
jgi:hypothetical protein